jgi:AcrR family transcriptional regulator
MAQQSQQPTLAARRAAREDRRATLLRSAAEVFADRGYHRAQMDEIASMAGVSKPVLYGDFGSKDELYLACVERAAERFGRALEEAVATSRTPAERTWLGITALLDAAEAERAGWALLVRAADAGSDQVAGEVSALRREAARRMAALLTDAARELGVAGSALESLEPHGEALVGAAEAVTRWWLEHPEVPKATAALYLMNFVWMGFGDLIEGRFWTPLELEE